MKITHVLFKSLARTRGTESMTTAMDQAYGEIEAHVHPVLGPSVRYVGQPWSVPVANIAGYASVGEPKPEPKPAKKPKADE